MFESKKVTLESKLTVVSSKPVRSGMSHTLSALDHAMGFHTLHIIYYYLNLDNWYGSFELDPLRHSLSEVLSAYPTMTGRLARGVDDNDHWEVKCNDAGVRVIKANVDTTLMEWLSSASSSDEALLISWEDMPHHPNIWSPFRIQINRFKEGGVAIGLSCSHMVADLTSAASFFKSWTETHRHVPLSHPPFFTTPSPLVNSFARHCRRTTLMSSSKTILTTPSTNMSTATFKFASSAIKKCLSKLQNDNVTPFEFLSALFWTSIAQLKHATNSDKTTTHHQYSLSICNDLRSLIKLPIGNYFGNALHFSKISLNVEDVKSDEIVEMASALIHKHLKEVEEDDEELEDIDDEWFESAEKVDGGRRSPNCIYGNEYLTCVRMFEGGGATATATATAASTLLYESMFGNNEKPVHVTCRVGNVNGEGLIMVMPSEEGGLARSVVVMLAEDQLTKLTNHKSILQLHPTIILSSAGVDS